jgi:stage II sporulation protein D
MLAWAALALFGLMATAMVLAMGSCQTMRRVGLVGEPEPRPPRVWTPTGAGDPSPLISDGVVIPAARVSGVIGEPEIRVRIARAEEGVELAGGDVGGALWVSVPDSRRPAERVSGDRTGGGVAVTRQGVRWRFAGADGRGKSVTANDIEILAAGVDGDLASTIVMNGASYAGRLRLSARTDVSETAFDVIEYVGLESYLPGVVAGEVLGGWRTDAYRVQAVCARTYAIHERLRSMATGASFDVESTTMDQVYTGHGAARWARDAVVATRGVMVTFGGAPLRTYYSSTCGGRSAGADETFPTGRGHEYNRAAPLMAHERAHACEDSPLYTWRRHRDRAELEKRIRAFGQSRQLLVRRLGTLHSIEASKRNDLGRPTEYRIIEPGGKWFALAADDLRVACNYSDGAGLPAVTQQTRINSGDMEFAVKGDKVIVDGRGFGHGVGMCQYCAQGFAKKGKNWSAMLRVFYPGAEVVKAY